VVQCGFLGLDLIARERVKDSQSMTETWPWLALAGLGAFHGANPAMGWLFALALGLHRGGQATIALALLPIALGHALSVGLVAGAFVLAGQILDARLLGIAGGLLLIGWGVALACLGHGGRVRFGLTTGMLGLFMWSLMTAATHGAGLMLIPALAPLCLAGALPTPVALGLAAVGLHTAAALAVTAAVAFAVHRWLGLALLRTAWINLDWLWIAALFTAGALLLL
jgi:hypothetical protein